MNNFIVNLITISGELFFKKLQERETIIRNERKIFKNDGSFNKSEFTSSSRPPKQSVFILFIILIILKHLPPTRPYKIIEFYNYYSIIL